MPNKFRLWIDTPQAGVNVLDPAELATDTQATVGFKAGDPVSALRVNSILRQASLIDTALMQLFYDLNITTSSDPSVLSSLSDIKTKLRQLFSYYRNDAYSAMTLYVDGQVRILNMNIAELQTQIDDIKTPYTFEFSERSWTLIDESSMYMIIVPYEVHDKSTRTPTVHVYEASVAVGDTYYEEVYDGPVVFNSVSSSREPASIQLFVNRPFNGRVTINY